MEAIYGVIIYFVVLALTGIVIVKIGNRNANILKFDIAYLNLQRILDCSPVNEKSYYEILEHLGEVMRYKYVNKEKLEVFKTEFKRRYDVISKNILAESDEFAPENVFYDLEN